MKIAIVHEWFDTYAGSEKVLEQILNVYPEADLSKIYQRQKINLGNICL